MESAEESDEESELDAAQEAADTFMLQPGERMFQLSPDADFEPIAEYRRGLTLEVVKVSPKEA